MNQRELNTSWAFILTLWQTEWQLPAPERIDATRKSVRLPVNAQAQVDAWALALKCSDSRLTSGEFYIRVPETGNGWTVLCEVDQTRLPKLSPAALASAGAVADMLTASVEGHPSAGRDHDSTSAGKSEIVATVVHALIPRETSRPYPCGVPGGAGSFILADVTCPPCREALGALVAAGPAKAGA